MKILILTLADSANTKIHLIIDKIVFYYEGEKGITVVQTQDGSWHYVKESTKFITNQLVSANESSYAVYNSEAHK